MSKAVSDAGKYGTINIERSPSYDTYIHNNAGFHFNSGYTSGYFVTDSAKQLATYENAFILLVDKNIERPSELTEVLSHSIEHNSPIVIIANEFSADVTNFLINNYLHRRVKVLPIKTPGFGEGRTRFLEDLEAFCDTNVVTSTIKISDLGKIDKIDTTMNGTYIYHNTDNPTYKEAYIKRLIEAMEDTTDTFMKEKYTERIAMLSTGITTTGEDLYDKDPTTPIKHNFGITASEIVLYSIFIFLVPVLIAAIGIVVKIKRKYL